MRQVMNKNLATFALATIGIVIGSISTSTISQSQSSTDPRCPAGYWLMARVCIDLDTGDVVNALAPSGVASEPGCAPGYWRLDKLCHSPFTGDVELVDETRWPAHQGGRSAGDRATVAELPTFELLGFPITPVQVQVVGSARVQEKLSAPTLGLDGMLASPHQIAVLKRRSRATEIATHPKEEGY